MPPRGGGCRGEGCNGSIRSTHAHADAVELSLIVECRDVVAPRLEKAQQMAGRSGRACDQSSVDHPVHLALRTARFQSHHRLRSTRGALYDLAVADAEDP